MVTKLQLVGHGNNWRVGHLHLEGREINSCREKLSLPPVGMVCADRLLARALAPRPLLVPSFNLGSRNDMTSQARPDEEARPGQRCVRNTQARKLTTE